ncbi:4Fe-4S cluster-binding domain-containing protein [Coprothermobacter platensis]|uniref:4Fe-4S cluster-binding domain-containing protein n=1 Tax=Coprothermobacter platensis TaxID=108819 RepID=UPI0003A1857F|nr:4Fe-4S cluster-binding domain-containing protein [Coprothermobacter platensis]
MHSFPEGFLGKAIFCVSSICNPSCVYCYEKENFFDVNAAPIMDKQSADRALEYILNNYVDILRVSFFGGEPLLNFSVIEALLYGLGSDTFCFELSKGYSETFDTKGERHPCFRLINYDVDDELVKACNSKNNNLCKNCWAKNICRSCTANILSSRDLPFLSGYECKKRQGYQYALQHFVGILEEAPDHFQRIVDNYVYFSN